MIKKSPFLRTHAVMWDRHEHGMSDSLDSHLQDHTLSTAWKNTMRPTSARVVSV